MGYRSLRNTLIYIDLADFSNEEEYTSKTAQTPKEIQQLIEAGFEYVCQKDGLAFFRKRKGIVSSPSAPSAVLRITDSAAEDGFGNILYVKIGYYSMKVYESTFKRFHDSSTVLHCCVFHSLKLDCRLLHT